MIYLIRPRLVTLLLRDRLSPRFEVTFNNILPHLSLRQERREKNDFQKIGDASEKNSHPGPIIDRKALKAHDF
jgi:hypothetical protein